MNLSDLAASLVREARAGDQVAMAQIACVHDDAPTSPKAAQSLRAILSYIDAHPAVESSSLSMPTFGVDAALPTPALRASHPARVNELAAVAETVIPKSGGLFVFGIWLAHGPRITNDHLHAILEALSDEDRGPVLVGGFLRGWKRGLPGSTDRVDYSPEYVGAYMGQAVRDAWILQNVRHGLLPLKAWSPAASEELGEDV